MQTNASLSMEMHSVCFVIFIIGMCTLDDDQGFIQATFGGWGNIPQTLENSSRILARSERTEGQVMGLWVQEVMQTTVVTVFPPHLSGITKISYLCSKKVLASGWGPHTSWPGAFSLDPAGGTAHEPHQIPPMPDTPPKLMVSG